MMDSGSVMYDRTGLQKTTHRSGPEENYVIDDDA